MEDKEMMIPSFMENGIDFKKSTIINFFNVIEAIKAGEIEGLTIGQRTSLRVITNFGLIEGKAVIFDEKEKEEPLEDQLYKVILTGSDDAMAAREAKIGPGNFKLVNHTGRLVLADAVITPFANPMNKQRLSRMLLFTDQIIGITFGEES